MDMAVNNQRSQKEEVALTKALKKEAKFKAKREKQMGHTDAYHVMGSCFKHPGDSKLPNTKEALKRRYQLTCT